MAKFTNNFQNFGYDIPADGEVFVNKNESYWRSNIYKRVGNKIIQFNLEEFAMREDPNQAQNRMRSYFGWSLLKSQYGIDYDKLPGYTGEGIGYFSNKSGGQQNITDISQFKDTSTEFTRSETITEGLNPATNNTTLLRVSSLSGKTPPPPAPAGALAALTAQTPGGQAAAKAAGQPISTPTPAPTPTPTQPKPASISDPSIVNFLDAQGKPSDFTSRTQLAGQQGITNYTGTAEQNTQMLDTLRKTVTPAIGSPEASRRVLAESTRVASEAA